jgi:hypothetical protein
MNTDAMIGRKYGALTVTGIAPHIVNSLTIMHVQCDCGTELMVPARDLRTYSVVRCDRCQMVPEKQRWLLSDFEKEAINRERSLTKQQSREAKKQNRILRLRQKLADARGITGNNGDGESQ